ncbi:MAG: Y4bD/Y4pK family protein [Humibacillus sp.]|nr:Y4bD/Y4pK family protein [Humibacillus sp.]MDN5779316.1 Y4bD/Y4pK family protein [Humibacillus sp.]
MTHPFHPLSGQEFEFVKRRRNWRADRVYVLDAAGELVSLPAEWTDVVPEDPFVVVAAGRSPFHIAGLLELSELVAQMATRRPAGGGSAVKVNLP